MEAKLESNLTAWAKAQGGIALKGATNFDTGYPDRVIYIPGAHAHAEIKGTSKRYHLNEKQKIWAGRIIASKSPYYIIENMDQLENFKSNVRTAFAPHGVNMYSLNGDQLFLYIDETKGCYDVRSHKGGTEKRILSGFLTDTVANLIYRIFVALEAAYPNTNYCDI